MSRVVKTNGFTLIELMLAMSFISVLLMTVTFTVMQISTIYNRGITYKELNDASRTLSTELQRSISSSPPFAIEAGTGSRYVQSTWGGRLCIGQYSYIWNYGAVLQTGSSATRNIYTGEKKATDNSIHFVKVVDPSASYCSASPLPDVDPTKAVELLNVGDLTLVLHNLAITSGPSAIDVKTNERLYNITFLIGTNDPAALTSNSSACLATNAIGANFSYCAVQQFTLAVRAGNAIK